MSGGHSPMHMGEGMATMDDSGDPASESASEKSDQIRDDALQQKRGTKSHSDSPDDGSDYDEMLTCLVCDRAFTTARQLMHHQTQKRHFCCSICDATFASAASLKQHRESQDHWSEREDESLSSSPDLRPCPDQDTHCYNEMERLL